MTMRYDATRAPGGHARASAAAAAEAEHDQQILRLPSTGPSVACLQAMNQLRERNSLRMLAGVDTDDLVLAAPSARRARSVGVAPPGAAMNDDEAARRGTAGAGPPTVRAPGRRAETPTESGPPVLDARELLGERGMLRIQHRGETYVLRITRNDRLILTK